MQFYGFTTTKCLKNIRIVLDQRGSMFRNFIRDIHFIRYNNDSVIERLCILQNQIFFIEKNNYLRHRYLYI